VKNSKSTHYVGNSFQHLKPTFAENFMMMTLQWRHLWTFSLGLLPW